MGYPVADGTYDLTSSGELMFYIEGKKKWVNAFLYELYILKLFSMHRSFSKQTSLLNVRRKIKLK